jgi:hypothetical protein
MPLSPRPVESLSVEWGSNSQHQRLSEVWATGLLSLLVTVEKGGRAAPRRPAAAARPCPHVQSLRTSLKPD